MTLGFYEEMLPCGGLLRVSAAGFDICYYWPEEGKKNSGEFFKIPGADVGKFAVALRRNFREFVNLSVTAPSVGVYRVEAEQGMAIYTGAFTGVTVTGSTNMPIATEEQLETLIASWKYARRRGCQMARAIGAIRAE